MSKKKMLAAFALGGLFALTISLVTGYTFLNWQWWVILLAGAAARLDELVD